MAQPSDTYHPQGDVSEVPLLRIVWMAEHGVNEQALNSVLTFLAQLSSVAQSWWFGDDRATSGSDNSRDSAVLGSLTSEINEITQILVDVVEVENIVHNERFSFRFGQCIRPNSLNNLSEQLQGVIHGLAVGPAQDRWDIVGYGGVLLRGWAENNLGSAYAELQRYVISEPQAFRFKISELLRAKLAEDAFKNLTLIQRSAESTLQDIDTAAGKVGAASLAKGFSTQLDVEAKRSRWWTLAVVISVLLGMALPVAALTTERIVFSPIVDPVVGTIIRVIIGLPFFALAAYFARIASQHRETERYLRILVTQIDSVQAYAAVLDDDGRQQLVAKLGHRAFADPGLTLTEKGSVSAVPEDVSALLAKALELVTKNQVGK